MANSIQNIQNQILATVASEPALSGLTSPSQTSIYNLWSFVTATAINVEENLWDNFQGNLETQIAAAPIGTDSWVNAEVFKFQYDATIPQIVTLTTGFTAQYPVIDVTKQIITRSSVKTQPSRNVLVKVATSNPPQALTTTQLSSLQAYLDTISFAGVQYNVVSFPSDKLLLGAQIYYNGQYGSTITGDTLTAFNNYMANIPFDGFVINSKIEEALLAVAGVTDVVLNNVAVRPDSTPVTGTTYLIQNNLEILRRSPLYAGYCINETTSGYTFADLVSFIPA